MALSITLNVKAAIQVFWECDSTATSVNIWINLQPHTTRICIGITIDIKKET